MRLKSGQIEHWIEIPIKVNYTLEPAERMTQTYPGCKAHIEIDVITHPDETLLVKLIDKEADAIEMACWEDVRESEYPS
jgi:hypothetical protein